MFQMSYLSPPLAETGFSLALPVDPPGISSPKASHSEARSLSSSRILQRWPISFWHHQPLLHLGWSQMQSAVFACLSKYHGSSLPWNLSFLMSPRKAIDFFSVCPAFLVKRTILKMSEPEIKVLLTYFWMMKQSCNSGIKPFLIMTYYYLFVLQD